MNEFVANQALNRGPVAPLSKIEIVAAGKVVRAIRPQDRQEPGGGFLTSVDELLEFDGSTWVAVRCFQRPPTVGSALRQMWLLVSSTSKLSVERRLNAAS